MMIVLLCELLGFLGDDWSEAGFWGCGERRGWKGVNIEMVVGLGSWVVDVQRWLKVFDISDYKIINKKQKRL
jgi:hypothetical protein